VVSALSIRALGPLEVAADGAPIAVGGAKQRLVLACLVLRTNTVVPLDALVEALWRETPPARPASVLQVYVANLRRLLEPDRVRGETSQRLLSRAGGYLLALRTEEVDLLQFRQHVRAGQAAAEGGDLVGAAEALRHAITLFRGPIFPDLADVEAWRAEITELEERGIGAHEELIEVELALGRHQSLVGEVQALVTQHPFRERLWASLVTCLYRSDRQADALAACRDARRLFAAELGIDPGPRLRQLERSVLRQDSSLAAPATDGRRRIRQRLNNLPADVSSLVGRDAELDELCSLFVGRGTRLVTVTGPGGIGKTRLALAVAGRIGAEMPDGVCWVDLAPLTEVEQVPAAVANVLGLGDRAGRDPLDASTNFLRPRRLLLVFDNFEHLEGAWPVVLGLLTAAADLRVLVTSRRALEVRGEYEYELTPLEVPPLAPAPPLHLLQEVPAVKLFLARGRAVRRQVGLTDENAQDVTRLCRRLDGLPLAIELAAAQLRHRTERALLDDLEVSLNSLPAAFRDLPARQQTLSATIAWSYELLGDSERQLFEQLGVFAADPAIAAVRSICETGARSGASAGKHLTTVAAHSLLRRYTDSAGTDRLSMLQSIREFARDRLTARGDAATVRLGHAHYYLSLAESLGPQLWGPDQVGAFQRLRAEEQDLRGALLWAASPEGSIELALALVGQLWHYWELTENVAEQCSIAQSLLADSPQVSPALVAPALSGTATLCWMLGRNDEAIGFHRRALDAFRSASNSQGIAWTTMCLALLAMEGNDSATAQRLAQDALSAPEASPRTRVAALTVLGLSAFYASSHSRALDLYRQGLEIARPLGDRWLLGILLSNLADSTEQAGDYDAAELLLHEALAAALELGAESHMAPFLETLAAVYVGQRRVEQAIRVLATAAAYRTDRTLPLNEPERRRVETIITKVRTGVGPIRFAVAWADGSSLTLDQVVREVLEPSQLDPRETPASAALEDAQPSRSKLETPLDAAPWPL
jgi:predicted ATPase/DNA-binding SARP family transcriptional activator